MQLPATVVRFCKVAAVGALAVAAGSPLLALPATLTLRPGRRPGLEPLTIKQAAAQLRATGLTGWPLVEAARALVAERMVYSRRNSFDPAPVAFNRGYGYCQQMSFALAGLLRELGFRAWVVQAGHNQLADGRVTAHSWVRVTHGGRSHDVDSLHYDAAAGRITFRPMSRVTGMGPLFRLFAGWGSLSVNAIRYYRTGRDTG